MPPVAKIVRMPQERKLERQIDVCRHGAVKDHVTVVIERTAVSRNPNVPTRRIPVLEITPGGDVREVPAPTLKTALAAAFPPAMRNAFYARQRALKPSPKKVA